MTLTILTLYLAVLALQCGLSYLNIRHLEAHGDAIPPAFAGAIDPQRLARASAYTLARGRLGLVRTLFDGGVTLLFIFGGPLAWFDSWTTNLGSGFITTGMAFFLVLSLAQTLLGLPFSLVSHFRIESRFGFNRMSLGLWCADQLKSLLLSLLFLGLLIAAALWLVIAAPASWWLWVWGVVVVFALLMMVISPYVIEPLFFKFEPLKVEGLEERVRALLEKAGLSLKKVLQVDASRRSGHSNAYFTGLGRQKRVVLFDTLLDQLTAEQLLAVLAHELGHMKKKHILKRLTLMAAVALLFCWLAWVLSGWEGLPGLVGLETASFYAKMVILFFLAGLVTFPLTPLSSALSRRDEYEADRFAAELHGEPDDLAAALVQMSRENLANLHPHPLYARVYYSHPPVVERVARLRTMRTEPTRRPAEEQVTP